MLEDLNGDKLPLVVVPDIDFPLRSDVWTANGERIGYGMDTGQAHDMVKAVNMHDRLVAALKDLMDFHDVPGDCNCRACRANRQARLFLKEAEE